MKIISQLLLILLFNISLAAQWSNDPTVNNPICVLDHTQLYPAIASDGSGGAIIAWQDKRNGSDYDIYAQRIDASGNIKWTLNGIPVCNAARDQVEPEVVSDGSGGAIITWTDERDSGNYDIYAQKVDSTGKVKWTANGATICKGAAGDENITSDGKGGAIITWRDLRSGTTGDIYAQRIDAGGNVRWTANGAAICLAQRDQVNPQLVSDGNGGAIILWYDTRSGNGYEVYTQKVDSSGNTKWQTNGIDLGFAAHYQTDPTIISDGKGGAIATWYNGSNSVVNIYAQRIDASGNKMWTSGGVQLNVTAFDNEEPTIAGDGSGGAYIVWQEQSPNGDWDIYAQQIDSTGDIKYQLNGSPAELPICRATDIQEYPEAVTDGRDGVIITWRDVRNGTDYNIYAQRLGADGNVKWTLDGVPVTTAAGNQDNIRMISDSNGGAIITWTDQRSGYFQYDIYAQKVTDPNVLSVNSDASRLPDKFKLIGNYPNPFNPSTTIKYSLPFSSSVKLTVYNILGQKIKMLVNRIQSAGYHEYSWNADSEPSGIYLYALSAESNNGKNNFRAVKKMILLK